MLCMGCINYFIFFFLTTKAKLQLAVSIFNSTLASCYVPEFYHTTCILYDIINDSSHTACNVIVLCYWIQARPSKDVGMCY
jgi:hypothetical protein